MARVLQQRQKAWWLEKTSVGNDRGRENKARKTLGKGAAGMGNEEVPTTREMIVNTEERPAEPALAEKGKFTF